MLRIQQERMSDLFFPTEREYSSLFGIDAERLALTKQSSILMHPGPMNRGLEISAEAADSEQSVVVEQVANGVSIRMAILYLFIAGGQEAFHE
jgi:aspartate carbamoyltransferase catalytic subunit